MAMSDTASRNPTMAAQMLADALLRTVAGTTATLRLVGANVGVSTSQSELGLVATNFVEVAVSPVVMRKLRPEWREGGLAKWELLVSASGVAQVVNAMDLQSAGALFAQTLLVTVGGQDFLIESVAANEAMGQVYVYRLLVRETVVSG